MTVAVLVGVLVAVAVPVEVDVEVLVGGTAVYVRVGVFVAVLVRVGVMVRVWLAVAVLVLVGVTVGVGPAVIISRHHPVRLPPAPGLPSSTIYRDHVPLGSVPLKADNRTLPNGRGAGGKKISPLP